MQHRSDQVPDCVRLTPDNVRTLNWLPPSCGYRLVAEGRDLYWWHPLISGDPNTVHEAGVSVRGRVQGTENEIADEDLEDHIVQLAGALAQARPVEKAPVHPRGDVITRAIAIAGRTHAPNPLPLAAIRRPKYREQNSAVPSSH